MKARDETAPSKTRRKRDAEALQALGEELAALPAQVLDGLGLPDRLRQALADLGPIRAHEARRRQRQFIGRLMRDVDPEPLQAVIEARRQPGREATRLFREIEGWRDRLVAEGEPAERAFAARHPETDLPALAAAVRAAQEGRSGAARKLFRLVKTIIEAGPACGDGSPEPGRLVE